MSALASQAVLVAPPASRLQPETVSARAVKLALPQVATAECALRLALKKRSLLR
jgi:hypothetical protein